MQQLLGKLLRSQSLKFSMRMTVCCGIESWHLAGKGSAAAAAQKEAAHEQAEAHKRVGNEAFQAGAYEEAVKAYTQAIEAKPKCAVWYSNRALAYLKVCCLLFFWHWRSCRQAVHSPGKAGEQLLSQQCEEMMPP